MHWLKEIDQSSLVIFDMSVIYREETCIEIKNGIRAILRCILTAYQTFR